jgi:hypothetical protein
MAREEELGDGAQNIQGVAKLRQEQLLERSGRQLSGAAEVWSEMHPWLWWSCGAGRGVETLWAWTPDWSGLWSCGR